MKQRLAAILAGDMAGDSVQSAVRDVSFNTFNERNGDGGSWWIAEWHCASGHLLYREDHGIRI